MINKENIAGALTYSRYRELLDRLLAENKTTGADQSKMMVDYTKLNIQRMKRLDSQVTLTDELKNVLATVSKKYLMIVLTEGWCIDTANSIPLFNKMEEVCPNLKLLLLLRDDNPAVMDQYLTNGGRSIPKLICVEEETMNERFSWGPRPEPLQEIVRELMKTKPTVDEKGIALQHWYNTDKTETLQKEIAALISTHLK